MTVNAVHSEGQVGGHDLESQSVDLVTSVLKIVSMVVPSAHSPPCQFQEARLLGTLQNVRRYSTGSEVTERELERKVTLLRKRNL